ncbi:M28 family peptidase [Shewanella acanthi]|nr:M28 family peptidase [Shewanella acanthi]
MQKWVKANNGLSWRGKQTQPRCQWLTLILLSLMINGCATDTTFSCAPSNLQLNWASPAELEQTVRRLSSDEFAGRQTETPGAALTRDYLNHRFTDIGLTPWGDSFIVPFEYQTGFNKAVGANVVGIAKAKEPTNAWRIVVAHYDHLGQSGRRIFHGADDNASGVSAMIAIATQWQQLLSRSPDSLPKVNMMFVATDAEETGLYGSSALVEQLQQRMPQAQIQLMLNLDMVGHPSFPYVVYLEGSKKFSHYGEFRNQLSANNHLCIKLSHPRPVGRSIQNIDWLRASDHYPFHKAQIPWLYFGVPTHAQYHTPEDTADTLDYRFLAAVAESALELLKLNSELLKN